MQIIQPGQTRTRHTRKPVFPVAGSIRPFGLYPMMITPVLPGETLANFEAKLRHLSLPIRNPFAGAWLEMWLVYVKLTDIDHQLAEMFVSTDMPTTGFTAAADDPLFYVKAGQIDYMKACTDAFHRSYFLDEGESPRVVEGRVPMIRASNINWAQNLMFKPDTLDASMLPSAGAEEQLTGIQLSALMQMTELNYEKYLQQYGVSQAAVQRMEHKPEILRYLRSWVTPTNTIDPATGTPSSCWSWSQTATAEKPRRFDEPGFVCVFHSVRPKLYPAFINSSMVHNLWGFADFFPAYNLSDPAAGIVAGSTNDPVFHADVPPVEALDLIWDHRDLLNHGEPFVNDWDSGTPRMGPYPLPHVAAKSVSELTTPQDLRHEYPDTDDIDALFSESTQQTPNATRLRCVYEGIAEIVIQGHVRDTTI